jgi:hydroxymethylpyrimidine/phosphomethylpyrimidine kinase
MHIVLTIAGYDPSSGAGVTADLKVFAAHGLFGTSCITALTVQSTVGVLATHQVYSEIVRSTLAVLHSDLAPAGIKIGMLTTADNVVAVADYLTEIRSHSPKLPVVLDPVLVSTSGRELLEVKGVTVLRERILPLINWITPNLDELAVLTDSAVQTRGDLAKAARKLQEAAPHVNILATGGHLSPPDDLLLMATGESQWLPGEQIETSSTHGTGCALSSALLSRLVLGDAPYPAAMAAKLYVEEALRTATPLGQGHGPVNHLWPLRRKG